MLFDKITKEVVELATPRQQGILLEVVACGSITDAAKSLGKPRSTITSTVRAALARATSRGYAPEHGLTTPYQDGFLMEKVTIHRRNGEVVNTWERMCADKEKQLELLRQAIIAICEEVTPYESVPSPQSVLRSDLMVNIPIGDAHIGLLAWGEECGDDYDLAIAEKLHCQAVDTLISMTPKAEHCTIIDLGDFMHADNLMGVTARSGHNLDMDGRYHKVVRTAIRISVHYINAALHKFEKVIFRPEVGNHNDVGAIWMQELLSILYQNEPRVTIGNTAGSVYFWQHGLCYFGSHHGHTIKFDKLPAVMSAKVMDEHIKTKFRKFYCGHIHHKTIRGSDFNTCEVQTYRTLAAKDAYSVSHGYMAPRDITAEIWHKQLGNIGTVNWTLPMMENDDGRSDT